MPTLRAGAFELTHPLASGGMGTVWAGLHAPSGQPVAIKVLRGATAREPAVQAAFVRELQAVAALDHPGIIVVLDHGTLPDDIGGDLVAGSPWLAMELARGPLEPWRHVSGWADVRRVLVQILDALAHAHARGVVHRDLKPDNLLWVGHRLRLADFGMAHALDRWSEQGGGGTPHYMAPEQFARAWRDFGPWTDLYALGCLAWELVSGAPPFAADTLVELASAHRHARPAELEPRFAVPMGLDGWLRWLLDKDPAARPACAADAAAGLAALGEALVEPGQPAPAPVSTALATLNLDDWVVDEGTVPSSGTMRQRPRASVPAAWHAPGRGASPRLSGAGLGLYGLRSVPFVDRDAARSTLWAALHRVVTDRVAGGVLLSGPLGVGRSRLATWLAQRAAELGVATPIVVRHGWPPGPRDGIAHALEGYLRCVGLNRREVARRVEGAVPEWQATAVARLVELVRPRGADDPFDELPAVTLSREAGIDVARAFVEHLSEDRPVVVVLDDIDRAPDALALAVALRGRRVPVLVLAVVDEATPVVMDRLRGFVHLPIPPLSGSDHRLLVDALLGLGSSLATEVAARTDGNPLFAIQLVGDWVQRGVLEGDGEGFVLAAGADASIPDDLHDLWTARVDEALHSWGPTARIALERAAVLGVEVDLDEWHDLCARGQVPVPDGLVDTLITRALASRTLGGWRFDHAMLVESLVRGAAEAGSLHEARVHVIEMCIDRGVRHEQAARVRTCIDDFARALAVSADVPERRARALRAHGASLHRVGELEGAWDEVREALRLAEATGDDLERAECEGTLAVMAAREQAWDEAEPRYLSAIVAFDALGESWRTAQARMMYADLLRLRGRVDEALSEITLAIDGLRPLGDAARLANALRTAATIHLSRGELARARAALEEGIQAVRGRGLISALVQLLTTLARILTEQGHLDDALAGFEEVDDLLRENGDLRSLASNLTNWAPALEQAGCRAEARVRLLEAAELHHRTNNRRFEALSLGNLGMLAKLDGDPGAARAHLHHAIALADATHEAYFGAMFRAWLAEMAAEEGDDSAWAMIVEAEATVRQVGERVQQGQVACIRGRIALALGRVDDARRALREARDIAAELGLGPESSLAQEMEALQRDVPGDSSPSIDHRR